MLGKSTSTVSELLLLVELRFYCITNLRWSGGGKSCFLLPWHPRPEIDSDLLPTTLVHFFSAARFLLTEDQTIHSLNALVYSLCAWFELSSKHELYLVRWDIFVYIPCLPKLEFTKCQCLEQVLQIRHSYRGAQQTEEAKPRRKVSSSSTQLHSTDYRGSHGLMFHWRGFLSAPCALFKYNVRKQLWECIRNRVNVHHRHSVFSHYCGWPVM